jgi:mono/diheme cytochrome c family protein
MKTRTRPRRLLALIAALALAFALPFAGTTAGGDPGAPADTAPPADGPAAAPVAAPAADGAPALTVGTQQVAEGATVYARSCAECHGARLEGFAHFPALVGPAFGNTWGDRPVGELHTYVVEQMPLGAGGTLSAEAYAAVVAFLLERNGVEPGEVPFDPSDARVAALDLTFDE